MEDQAQQTTTDLKPKDDESKPLNQTNPPIQENSSKLDVIESSRNTSTKGNSNPQESSIQPSSSSPPQPQQQASSTSPPLNGTNTHNDSPSSGGGSPNINRNNNQRAKE